MKPSCKCEVRTPKCEIDRALPIQRFNDSTFQRFTFWFAVRVHSCPLVVSLAFALRRPSPSSPHRYIASRYATKNTLRPGKDTLFRKKTRYFLYPPGEGHASCPVAMSPLRQPLFPSNRFFTLFHIFYGGRGRHAFNPSTLNQLNPHLLCVPFRCLLKTPILSGPPPPQRGSRNEPLPGRRSSLPHIVASLTVPLISRYLQQFPASRRIFPTPKSQHFPPAPFRPY